MQQFTKKSIDSLSDVFCAWLGFVPEKDAEIKEFLAKNPDASELISFRDIDNIIQYDAYFSDETVEAMYALLPIELSLADGSTYVLSESKFRALNNQALRKVNSAVVNIDMYRAFRVFTIKYPLKRKLLAEYLAQKKQNTPTSTSEQPAKPQAQAVVKPTHNPSVKPVKAERTKQATTPVAKKPTSSQPAKPQAPAEDKPAPKTTVKPEKTKTAEETQVAKTTKTGNKRRVSPEAAHAAYLRYYANMSEEKKQEMKEKARERARKRRLNPEVKALEAAKQRKRRENRSAEQIEQEKIASRERNRIYRERNHQNIRQRNIERRRRLKEENPELLREMDRAANARSNHRENSRRYYEKHKDEIALKAKNNPKAAEYKRKFKVKKRFKEKTGPQIMTLLQAIIDAKQRNG